MSTAKLRLEVGLLHEPNSMIPCPPFHPFTDEDSHDSTHCSPHLRPQSYNWLAAVMGLWLGFRYLKCTHTAASLPTLSWHFRPSQNSFPLSLVLASQSLSICLEKQPSVVVANGKGSGDRPPGLNSSSAFISNATLGQVPYHLPASVSSSVNQAWC